MANRKRVQNSKAFRAYLKELERWQEESLAELAQMDYDIFGPDDPTEAAFEAEELIRFMQQAD